MQLVALKKVGCKTVFEDEVTGAHVKLPWLQNVELRRRVQAGPNKDEARNALVG